MKRTLKERILEAETKANNWLARANELREAGKDDTCAMEKAQRWLDKLNALEGKGRGLTPRALDGGYCTCPQSVPRYDAGDGWKCHWCNRPRK